MNPWGGSRSIERGISTRHNYYLPLVTGLVTRPASVVGVSAGRSTQHNPNRSIGGRPEPTPLAVVAPTSRRPALAAPEPKPPLHVCFGNPHPLMPSLLREGHDVRHDFDDSAPSHPH
jgi:hypothetical protein